MTDETDDLLEAMASAMRNEAVSQELMATKRALLPAEAHETPEDYAVGMARAVITALYDQGYAVVPVEATADMEVAGLEAGVVEAAHYLSEASDQWASVSVAVGAGGLYRAAHRAMCAASPVQRPD